MTTKTKVSKSTENNFTNDSIGDIFAELAQDTIANATVEIIEVPDTTPEVNEPIETAIVDKSNDDTNKPQEMTQSEIETYVASIPLQVITYLNKSNKSVTTKSATKIGLVDTCPEVKVGQLANKNLRLLIPTLDTETITNFQSATYCKTNFNLSYPILVPAISSERKPERHYTGTVLNNGQEFYITSEWFIKNKPQLLKFLEDNNG